MLRPAVVLAALLLALAAAGCGGGNGTPAADTTTTESAMEDTTSDGTTTDEAMGTGDLSAVLADEDCLALAGIGATIAQAYAGQAGTSEDNSAELEALASKVPDEIRADVETLAKWYADYGAKVKDIGITAGQTPSADQLQQLQAALASLDQPEVTAASERISAWARDNCSAAGG